jgi:PTH1 family peptidyl-tRNA hydrolase
MKNNNIYLAIGLGNPGPRYQPTRHNIGFRLIDKIVRENSLSFKDKGNYHFAVLGQEDRKIIFLKPMMYMNLSGIPVLHVASYYKVPAENIIVAYDDVALPLGKIRIRKKGSAGGHNGVKSIIENLGKDHFLRIRLGIGESPGIPLDSYVLSRFSSKEEEGVLDMLGRATDAFWNILDNGPDTAMNEYNA